MMKTSQSSDMRTLFNTLEIDVQNPSFSTGLHWNSLKKGQILEVTTPINNEVIGKVELLSDDDYEKVIASAQRAFKTWRVIPAPQRGEIVRQYGLALRKYKLELGTLVSLECGKILQEGLGEVQEMIDICDFAVGLSRQLHGFTMHRAATTPHVRAVPSSGLNGDYLSVQFSCGRLGLEHHAGCSLW
jgi:aldehyde dehydrogenase (NAD+)